MEDKIQFSKTANGYMIHGKEFSHQEVINAGIRGIHRNRIKGTRRQPIGKIDHERNKRSKKWLNDYLNRLMKRD